MPKKLFIFDCDGVLVDSEFIASKVFSEALTAYGYPISVEESIRRFTGVSEHDARFEIMSETSLEIPHNYWVMQKPVLSKAYREELSPLMQPILDVLTRHGISRCVASNSSKGHVLECLEVTKQLSYFEEGSIFSSHQVPRAKPAPDLFLYAAGQMGFNPEDCVVVEDSAAGAQAAIAAGMSVLMFLGGRHARYDWYRERISAFGKPIHLNSEELLQTVQALASIG